MFEFLMAQVARPEASVDPPPEEAKRFLEEKSGALDALESLLIAGPPPEWAFDLSVPRNDQRAPNGLGQMRVQRMLLARALVAAQGGQRDVAARTLEASWNLNESLRTRSETISALLGIAIARLEIGVLRKVNVEESVWQKRLTALDPRATLLDQIGLDYRLSSLRTNWNAAKSGADRSSFQPAWDFLGRPWYRLQMADWSDAMRRDLERLPSSPLILHRTFQPENATKGWGLAQILASITIPNIRNSFVRADRLALDAELTGKILRVKTVRAATGTWPPPSAELAASRFPGLSWNYSVDAGAMTIALA